MTFDEPIPDFETRFEGKLEGILESVRQTYGGNLLNPTVLDASVAYFVQLLRGHPFKNGNKRMAVLFAHIFLLANGVELTLIQEEFFALAVKVIDLSKEASNDTIKQVVREVFANFSNAY